MRSLFHFPFPAQPPSQQPSPTATVSLQSEMRHRPHPAPMRRQRRSPALLSAARPLPRSRAYLDPAHGPLSPAPRGPAMPRPHPCLAPPPAPIAPHHLSTAPLPPAPIGLASSASRPPHAVARIASTPLRAAIRIPLCRHRADSALIAPHHDHRAPPPSYTCCASPSASRPPCADIRVTLSRCVGPGALAGKNRAVCIPLSPNALKRPSSWQHPLEMHAFRDQDGNILAPCIHFRAQSGDSGCMARESCRQGPFFASRNPKSRMARRCCQRRPAFPRQRPAVRRNGLCAMRQRHAARGMAERALRPAARAWPACRMRPPAISPAFIAAVLHAPRFAVRDPPRGPRTDASRHLRAAPIPPAARTHRVQETSGTAQTTQRGHKNRIPKWRPY